MTKSEALAAVGAFIALELGLESGLIGDGTSQAAPKKGEAAVECFGINSCKGTNGCGIGAEQIKLANQVFKDSYLKSKSSDCAGTSDCAAKKGFLAWVSKPNGKACFAEGGFIFEKNSKGQLIIKDKDGEKKV